MSLIKSIPWAFIAVFIQLVGVFLYWKLVFSDAYGYAGGSPEGAVQASYWILGFAGLGGVIVSLIGMVGTLWDEPLRLILLKIVLVHLPCLFLSVVWFYTWLFLLAWI